MFCHGAFAREAGGTVRFEYISMKGREPRVPSWSEDLFDARCKELERLEREVSSLYPGFRSTNFFIFWKAGSI